MPDTIDDAQEHPIIFNEWSIQRIFAREKTQTRRIATEDSTCNRTEWMEDVGTIGGEKGDTYTGWAKRYPEDEGPSFGIPIECPYGQPGDVLWCREAFRLPHTYDEMSPSEYVDGGQPHIVRFEADKGDYNVVPKDGWGRKRPSIHMPRELCRLRLRVEDVRVGRVQEISREDALAEGADPPPELTPKWAFGEKWNEIHGDGAWERNDWVWVITFSRIDNT